jgi:hypothetical protein
MSNHVKIDSIEWGKIVVDGETYRDVRIFSTSKVVGVESWDWKQCGTHHSPGITADAVKTLVERGAKIVLLSQGFDGVLKIPIETIRYLNEHKILVLCSLTGDIVQTYNRFAAEGKSVAALVHSTC